MKDFEIQELRDRFEKAYQSLSPERRDDVIHTSAQHGPMNWHAVFVQLDNGTPVVEQALEMLAQRNLI